MTPEWLAGNGTTPTVFVHKGLSGGGRRALHILYDHMLQSGRESDNNY